MRGSVVGAASSLLVVLGACAPSPPSPEPLASPPLTQDPAPSPTAATTGGLTFAAKGDFGDGSAAQAEVTARMCEMRRTAGFAHVVTTGDNFYDPDGEATRENYFVPEACLIAHPEHEWKAVWGNHDLSGSATSEFLGAPGRYYSWSWEAVEFLMLDSNASADDAQRTWLAEKLRSSQAEVLIAVFHHPPFTAGRVHPPDEGVRRRWVPMFERYGVTLVLNGHQHLYEHLSVNGIDYVVTGGGGRSLYPCGPPRTGSVRCLSRHHFLLVEVVGASVTVTAVGAGGETLDRFTKRVRRPIESPAG